MMQTAPVTEPGGRRPVLQVPFVEQKRGPWLRSVLLGSAAGTPGSTCAPARRFFVAAVFHADNLIPAVQFRLRGLQ